ncbi:MAG: hypothetical protein K5697_01030 [Lachnospiraceae bacterium]|nr:hypothetical protein [Lachnospiraceae bacterium]
MTEELFVILSDALLALSVAFALNCIIILLSYHKKKPSDDELLSGSCTEFEIKAAETEPQKMKRRFGIF